MSALNLVPLLAAISGTNLGGDDAFLVKNPFGPKTLTVTADDKSKTYGAADPTFTFKVEGFVSPDSFTLIDSIMILCMVVIGGMGNVAGQLSKVKVLAIQSGARSKLIPNVPITREVGLGAFPVRVWWGLVMNTGTPDNAIMPV